MERAIDANLNRLREGIRVIEDIARYVANDKELALSLKNLRHKARINKNLLSNRNVKNDILKPTIAHETERKDLQDVAIANFKRAQESARVLEELLKLESSHESEIFKNIRYELYDIEISFYVRVFGA